MNWNQWTEINELKLMNWNWITRLNDDNRWLHHFHYIRFYLEERFLID